MENRKFSGILVPRASFYLWIMLVLVIVIGILNFWVAIPGFLLLLFLVYYNFRSNYKRQREVTRYIENLTFNMDVATKDTLLNFPMPFVIVELDGRIIWYNSSFKKIFEGEDLLEMTIDNFIKDLKPVELMEKAPNISRDVLINGRNYCVLGNYVKVDEKPTSRDYMLLMYLVDNTEYVELKKRYHEEKATVGLIVIDNYDDLMQSMADSERPQMLAEIEKRISQWMSFTGGIIKKFERDKYLFVFEFKHLKEFEEKKFDILDIVKEISIGNKIPVTLSLGFGINGHTLVENFQFANFSIDLALGRGGDQVVIKDSENFRFYGGRTRELEKRTKVKARVIAYALRELVEQSENVMIMGHENCDIDSLGSALGIYRIAANMGKDVHIVLNSANPTIDKLLLKIEKSGGYEGMFIGKSEALNNAGGRTLLVVVDTHRPGLTECPELLEITDKIVVIDHHRRGTDFIQDAVLSYQETYASSTCELVTEILQYVEEKIRIMPVEAEALYAGIIVDTKNFSFKTGVRTFEAASFLRRQGVDTVSVKQLFQNDLETYVNISNIVRDAEIMNDNIAISMCPPNVKNPLLISAQAADQLLSLSGLIAAFVLSQSNNEVSISGRSLGELNVQVILEKLGGGGHMTIAGAQLQGTSMNEAKEKLKYAIIEYMENENTEA